MHSATYKIYRAKKSNIHIRIVLMFGSHYLSNFILMIRDNIPNTQNSAFKSIQIETNLEMQGTIFIK